MKKIQGLIVAPFTGMLPDGSINLTCIKDQVKLYKNNGVSGAFICGTTGESSALTYAEKVSLYREWAKYQDESFTLIAFVGGASVHECMELAKLAQELGYSGISFTAPYYFKPKSVAALAECCRQVASAAPETDFYYYHIPSFTGVDFPMIQLLTLMDETIPNLAGIKYTFENMMDYQQCLYFKNKKYNIMWGRDEMYLEALALGAVAAVGSTYNYSSRIYLEIQQAFVSGDHKKAADLQYKAIEFISLLNKFGQGTGKAMMKQIGLDLGKHRLPVINLTEAQNAELAGDLKALGFDQYASR